MNNCNAVSRSSTQTIRERLGLSVYGKEHFFKLHIYMQVVIYVVFNPRYCIGIGIGRGKSLTCITAVESMTSPIVVTLGSSILIRYRFINKRRSKTMKTIGLPTLALLVNPDWTVSNLFVIQK